MPTVIEQAAAILEEEKAKAPPPLMAVGLNREAWLDGLVEKLRPFFEEKGYLLGERIYISAGWPSRQALSRKKRRIGECWAPGSSKDGIPHIFISPALEERSEVAETVVHELGHAVLPGAKHGPQFKKFMNAVGLEGKPTATVAGAELAARLAILTDELGPYPHSKLSAVEAEKKQSTRMLKLQCSEHAEFIVRASRKVIDLGLPICGVEECGKELEEAA